MNLPEFRVSGQFRTEGVLFKVMLYGNSLVAFVVALETARYSSVTEKIVLGGAALFLAGFAHQINTTPELVELPDIRDWPDQEQY